MPIVQIDAEVLQDLFGRRDELVQAITAGITAEEWDSVMRAFDGLLAALARLESSIGPADPA